MENPHPKMDDMGGKPHVILTEKHHISPEFGRNHHEISVEMEIECRTGRSDNSRTRTRSMLKSSMVSCLAMTPRCHCRLDPERRFCCADKYLGGAVGLIFTGVGQLLL